jgi:hypothetical protein
MHSKAVAVDVVVVAADGSIIWECSLSAEIPLTRQAIAEVCLTIKADVRVKALAYQHGGSYQFAAASDRARELWDDQLGREFARVSAGQHAAAAHRFEQMARQEPAGGWADLARLHRRKVEIFRDEAGTYRRDLSLRPVRSPRRWQRSVPRSARRHRRATRRSSLSRGDPSPPAGGSSNPRELADTSCAARAVL